MVHFHKSLYHVLLKNIGEKKKKKCFNHVDTGRLLELILQI